MSKFKVGDRVRIVSEKIGSSWNPEGEMDKWLGKTMTVKKVVQTYYEMVEDDSERGSYGWSWHPWMIAGLASGNHHSIHITCTDGKTTHAVKKVDGEIVARSKAVCCPSDEFNPNIGAQLAFNRLVYGTDYNPAEVALKPEQPKQEDKPTYKAGDKVKVIGNGNPITHYAKVGSIQSVRRVFSDSVEINECFQTISFADIEPYTEPESTEPKQEPVKLYCGKVICVESNDDSFTIGKAYEFKDGLLMDNQGATRPHYLVAEKIKSLSDEYLKHWPYKFIEFKGE